MKEILIPEIPKNLKGFPKSLEGKRELSKWMKDVVDEEVATLNGRLAFLVNQSNFRAEEYLRLSEKGNHTVAFYHLLDQCLLCDTSRGMIDAFYETEYNHWTHRVGDAS